jgi:hypothetical protein
MLHAAIHWPEAYDPSLWPFALSYACHIVNTVPKMDTNLSPEEMWTGMKIDHAASLDSLLPWGIPAYVLDARLANGGSIPKFKPRSRRGQFLGVSPYHSQKSVGLIRNLKTMRVSPQYHVVYDPQFSTTLATEEVPPDDWEDLVMYKRHQCDLDFDMTAPEHVRPYVLHSEWLDEAERRERREEEELRHSHEARKLPSFVRPTEEAPAPRVNVSPPASNSEEASRPSTEEEPVRRSKRERQAPDTLSYDVLGGYSVLLDGLPEGCTNWYDAAYLSSTLFHDAETGTVEDYLPGWHLNPWSLLAKKKHDPDLPNFQEAMAGPHKSKFVAGMELELSQLVAMGTWTEVDLSSLPVGSNVIKVTWAFKIARMPDGSIKKFKSRFCVRGDTQIEGLDVFETHAPVVQWSTIRMCLSVANQKDLKTRAIDISNAFVSASLAPDDEIYIDMPRGSDSRGSPFSKPGTVFKLAKSLYGLRQSPKLFFDHLKGVLMDKDGMNFGQATMDQCLFIRKDIIIVSYVDDLLFFSPSNELIDKAIADLQKAFTLTQDAEDETVFAYLGIQVKRGFDDAGKPIITLLQPGLVNKLLDEIKDSRGDSIGKSHPFKDEFTPANGQLGAAKDDFAFDEREFGFSYASILGMMMYVVHTRPDIQFAVHQCARFTHNPKKVHGQALRRIARYLRSTKNEGLRFTKSDGPIKFDNFVDADFAGLFGIEDVQDPASAKSRTGYIFTLGGNPVHWVSKLQTTIALSTVEAEYVALSMSLREFIPMRKTAELICKAFEVDLGEQGFIKSTVWEDNMGALQNAKRKRITPRTKHINVIYHWFWSNINDDTGLQIEKIDTTLQKADIATKGLEKATFQSIRKLIMGW